MHDTNTFNLLRKNRKKPAKSHCLLVKKIDHTQNVTETKMKQQKQKNINTAF